MELVLCRHGETDYNAQKRLQGWLETPINENGKKQAHAVSEAIKNEDFYAAFCSPQKRCRMTAEIILKNHPGLRVEYRDELKEVNVGIYSGMNHSEIEKKFPGKWAERVDSKYDFFHENGESYKSVDESRVKSFLNELQEKYSSRKILIITHQGLGDLIIGSMLGFSGQEKLGISIPNDCIYFVEYRPHKTVVSHFLAQSKKRGSGWLEK
jgi:broad specificity phosphatase PhoE